ncbi:Zinc knuckle CX2CX4HX4C [Artemisia annua]|uniref:Zinc knuckle CX2CX4HX4C n=1 Tax=Artemisia annua TaxID=35608 RepID=A0A2U1MKB6_ARTAN|nr:Zinc knuckle CX2CX4HX4C [Artemisia annua]
MDRMTTSICEKPYGRASFARVLVEIDSSKSLLDSVELWYEGLGKVLRLWIEYSWVPPRCEECKIFGHYLSECARKVNTVRAVNKDGETVRPTDVKQSDNNNGANVDDGDEGWQTATRRNGRNTGNNYRQGQVGNYNVRRGGTSNRGGFNNRGNPSVSNVGVKDTSKRSEPINSGSVGYIDDSIVDNDKGEPVNKGNGNSKNSKSGNEVRSKEAVDSKSIATSNRFDLLSVDGGSEAIDPWNEVKVKVANACNTNVPIEESVLKGWNADMVLFYSVKWNSRTRKSDSVKQHFDSQMKSLSSQIAQIRTDSIFCAGRLYCLWRCYYVIDWGDDYGYNQLCTTDFGLASALACILVDWSIACYALQNRVRNSALAVLFYVGIEFWHQVWVWYCFEYWFDYAQVQFSHRVFLCKGFLARQDVKGDMLLDDSPSSMATSVIKFFAYIDSAGGCFAAEVVLHGFIISAVGHCS